MQYDRQLTISAAGSRWADSWPAQSLMWSDLLVKLSTPVRSSETQTAYLRMSKAKQDKLKDVGGFVGGELTGGKRRGRAVRSRDLVTLDMDALPADGTNEVLRRLSCLGCAWAVYSTRKHEPVKPRLRVIIPLDVPVAADHYEPIARKLAELINIDWCDPTTFQAVRMMYWPSVCVDAPYVYSYEDKPFVSAQGVLSMYRDWRDVTSWPQVVGQAKAQKTLAEKQEDPTEKRGVIGAFCRVYSIRRVMEEFLPGTYVPAGADADRFTFTGGSTTGGALCYYDKWLYSHHATDPAGGTLVNAFDLLRLHRFGDRDEEAHEGTPANKLPSYVQTTQLAVSLPEVRDLLNKERYEDLQSDFGPLPEGDRGDPDWMSRLKVHPSSGLPEKTSANVLLMLEHDPRLAGRFKMDAYAQRIYGEAPLPWGSREYENGDFAWTDADSSGLRLYADRLLGFRSKEVIEDAFNDVLARHSYNPVTEYLEGLVWDQQPRLDTLLIDYLGAEDSAYTRTVTRKAFTAAVARAMVPGTKFDVMTILTGAQGIGKSTLLRKMARGRFNDGIRSFEGKEASELLQGVWIVEISELEAFNKSDTSRIKQFLSQDQDIYRAAYGRYVTWTERRCVFFGTSNHKEYLRDPTGNRRFWPVDVGLSTPTKSVFRDLDGEIDQLWAEAVIFWRGKEALYLTDDVAEAAVKVQEDHRETSPKQGMIHRFLDQPVPGNWAELDLQQRLTWLGGGYPDNPAAVKRDRICAMEVWCECFKGDAKMLTRQNANEINEAIAASGDWNRTKQGLRFGYAGYQRGWTRNT